MKETEKETKPKNGCQKCGSESVYVKRYGQTYTTGDVFCSKCDTYIRMWDAY